VGASTGRLQQRRSIGTHVRACAGRARTPRPSVCGAPRRCGIRWGGSGAPRPQRLHPLALRHPLNAWWIPPCQHPHQAGPGLGKSSQVCHIHRAHLPPGPPDACRAEGIVPPLPPREGASSGKPSGGGHRGPCNGRRGLGGAHEAGRAAPPMGAASRLSTAPAPRPRRWRQRLADERLWKAASRETHAQKVCVPVAFVAWSVHGTCAVSCPRPDTPPRCRSAEHQGTNFFHLALIAAYIVIPAFLQNPRLGIFSLCVVAVLAVAICWRMQATHKQRAANGQAKNAVPQKGARSAETPRPVHKRGKQGLTVVHQDGWLIMWLCVDGVCLTYVVRSSVPKLLCFSEEGAGADRISDVVLAELQKAYRLTLAEGLVGAACFMYFACVLCLLLCL
jgi:hypothetical protein